MLKIWITILPYARHRCNIVEAGVKHHNPQIRQQQENITFLRDTPTIEI